MIYGCETRSLTLREECRLRVFEYRILWRISGTKRIRMGSGEGSTMRNFIFCTVQIRVIESRRLRWADHMTRMVEARWAFKILTGKPTGKIPLGRPRRREQYDCICICFDEGVTTVQCTATFSDLLCSPEFRYY